ncbi:hypothetical protein BpHYR1_025533 [Brachionus plicatilis]|uniref:Transmembrane protein n=1 Tax=Brachionus plicatilis TaxID=10195 RepID=A0A3M7SBJ6_BRAPC|nr:hypothetical protein BpHYR1_025533 [Brachionus plicatilis]
MLKFQQNSDISQIYCIRQPKTILKVNEIKQLIKLAKTHRAKCNNLNAFFIIMLLPVAPLYQFSKLTLRDFRFLILISCLCTHFSNIKQLEVHDHNQMIKI